MTDLAPVQNGQVQAAPCDDLQAEVARLHTLRVRAVSALSWLCGRVEGLDGEIPASVETTLADLLEG